nr:uncharacterized protein LOC117281233 isoform X3 [Nicotiana tomentosiformis]
MIFIVAGSVIEASCFSIKVYHGGLMKQQSTKHYVGAVVDYFDYVKPTYINMTELRKMAEICGYVNDSVIFWHKCVVEKETRDTWLDVVRITLMLFWDGVPVTIAAIVLFGS